MSNQQPKRTDAARLAKEVEHLVRRTPPEVIQRMDQRLQKRRKLSSAEVLHGPLHRRAG